MKGCLPYYSIILSWGNQVKRKRGTIMEEFARIIYEQWAKQNEDRNLFFAKGGELLDRLEDILSVSLVNEIYDTYCDSCFEIEQNSFIEGFAYACKCLSNGKIELKGGACDE
jgi:hypothetical protein